MRYQSIFSCVLLVILFSFCKKDKSTTLPATTPSTTPVLIKPTKPMYVSNELKEWGYFNVGSYWIMQDSATGAIDSIYVHKVTTQNVLRVMPGDTDIIAEQITIHLNEYAENLILTPFQTIERFGGINGNMTCFHIDSTYSMYNYNVPNFTVLNNSFGTVRCFQFSRVFPNHNHYNYTHYETSFWKKNVGYVKRKFGIGESVNTKMLLRYHIIQ